MTPALDWSPDATFTEAHARFLMARGACAKALRFVGQTVDQAADAEPLAALEYARDLLTPERLDACAKAKPLAALYCARDLLTPERLDACAEAEPWAALKYARDLLTPERRAWCERMLK